jgi:hypothetical protein
MHWNDIVISRAVNLGTCLDFTYKNPQLTEDF